LDVTNYHVVNTGLATSGQPSADVLRGLAEQGFKTVINLRTDAEAGTAEEAEIIQSVGLRYVHVPVMPATLSLEDVATVADILDDPAAGPVLLHCASANRVGAIWTLIQAQEGRPAVEAIAEGREIGLRDGAVLDAVERLMKELEAAE
jgi:uncharacterized protein (TIGR01244 family)